MKKIALLAAFALVPLSAYGETLEQCRDLKGKQRVLMKKLAKEQEGIIRDLSSQIQKLAETRNKTPLKSTPAENPRMSVFMKRKGNRTLPVIIEK